MGCWHTKTSGRPVGLPPEFRREEACQVCGDRTCEGMFWPIPDRLPYERKRPAGPRIYVGDRLGLVIV